jgi:hemoglobin-like flavoprotein
MTLTTRQIEIIQSAIPTITSNAEGVATAFYAQLFALDPSLRPMFRGDMAEQGRKLMTMLGTALNNVERLDSLLPALQNMGRRHVAYGVEKHHYGVVGQALINTLEMAFGAAFTPEARAAWVTLYGALVEAITNGLYGPQTEAAAD